MLDETKAVLWPAGLVHRALANRFHVLAVGSVPLRSESRGSYQDSLFRGGRLEKEADPSRRLPHGQFCPRAPKRYVQDDTQARC